MQGKARQGKKKTIPIALVIALGYFSLISCEEDSESINGFSIHGVSETNAIKDETAIHGDAPSTPVAFVWQDVDENTRKKNKGLTLTVENISSRNIEFQVSIEFAGLIRMIENVDLGRQTLPVGESVDLFVDGKNFPIQCPSGACQARALVKVFNGADSEKNIDSIFSSENVYYRHDKGYSNVTLFTENVLIEQENGYLSGSPNGNGQNAARGTVIGRVKDKKGGFRDVGMMNDEFAHVVDGQIVGWETGASISIGYDI